MAAMKIKLMGIGRGDGAMVLSFCTIASRKNRLGGACAYGADSSQIARRQRTEQRKVPLLR